MPKIKEQKNLIEIAKIEDIPLNTGKTLRAQGLDMALFRLSNGQVKVIENRCPHKGGVLAEGIVCGEHVFCPMHDQKIDLSTGLVQAPDTGCVKTYRVVVQDEYIYIDFSPSSGREEHD